MTVHSGEARSYRWRLSLFFAAQFGLYGLQLPYFSVWLDWRGLTATEIGMVVAVPMLLRILIGPTAAFLADRAGDRRRAIMIGAACALTAVLALTQSSGLVVVGVLTAIFLVGVQTGGPIGEAIALAGVRDHGLDYGRMRLWGSISFIAATFAGGAMLAWAGAGSVIWMVVTSMAIVLVSAWLLPMSRTHRVGDEQATARGPVTLADVRSMAGSLTFLLLIASAGLVQASHALFYAFGVLHWQAQGIPTGIISTLWSISIVVEVAVFAWSGRLVSVFGPLGLILLGASAAVVRWGFMAFDPPVAMLVPLQMLHAVTFGVTHLGTMYFIQQAVPREQAGTAQAIFAAATGGLGMSGATLLSGYLFAPYAGMSYLAMAAIAGVAWVAAVTLKRLWKPEQQA